MNPCLTALKSTHTIKNLPNGRKPNPAVINLLFHKTITSCDHIVPSTSF